MAENKKFIRSLAELKKFYTNKVVGYLGDRDAVEKLINEEIRRGTCYIVWEAMGIEYDWGRLRIGSSYNSQEKARPLVQFIQEKATKAAKAWITEMLKDDFMPKLSPAGERAVRAQYTERYLSEIHDELRMLAEQKAKEDAKKLMKIFAQHDVDLKLLVEKLPPETEDEDEDKDGDENEFDDDEDEHDPEEARRVEKMFVKRNKK